jgi:hypothetical protein
MEQVIGQPGTDTEFENVMNMGEAKRRISDSQVRRGYPLPRTGLDSRRFDLLGGSA